MRRRIAPRGRGSESGLCSQSAARNLFRMNNPLSRLNHRFPTALPAFASALALFASFPPLDWYPLAWVAPAGWLLLVRRDRLAGRRPYWVLTAAGFAFWLGLYWWLCLPHWATNFGWLAIAVYHSIYLPVFVAVSRAGVHGLGLPLFLTAPVVWTGLEYIRAHLLTGITMGAIGYTQYRWIELIQIADLVGFYGVGFVMIAALSCAIQALPYQGSRLSTWPIVPLVGLIGATLAYGLIRQGPPLREPSARVALIQGSIDTQFDAPEDTPQRVMEQYLALSRRAVNQPNRPDLIVWPETMFRIPLLIVDDDAVRPEGFEGDDKSFVADYRQRAAMHRQFLTDVVRRLDTPMIIGVDLWHFRRDGLRRYNSAVHVDNDGEILGRYDKMHLVLFGEYVPLAGRFPVLQRFTPLPFSIDAGDQPAVFEHRRLRLSPSICYENVLPHVIRRQLVGASGEALPDAMVNLTNDGWFWGSSELQLHLMCAVFRAVEFRRPMLVAANTGISAAIDGDGRILAQGPRRQCEVLTVDLARDGRGSPYLLGGDWFAFSCSVASGGLALSGIRAWLRRRRRSSALGAEPSAGR